MTRSHELIDVALIGPAGVGKDTVAKLLVTQHGYTRVAFADALKDALLHADPLVGMRRIRDVVESDGWDRAKVNPEVRRLLQEFGMAIREINCEFWVDALARSVDEIDGPVVITDLRMLNEYDYAVHELNALIVRLDRPGVDTGVGWRAHTSERSLDSVDVDLEISGEFWSPASAAQSIWVALQQEGVSHDQ